MGRWWRGDEHARRSGGGDHDRRQVAAADRGVARDRRQHPRASRNRRPERALAARHRGGNGEGGFAITEPDAGTNSHNLSTSLDRRGDGFVLNGQKIYISGVEHADAVLVVARSRLPDGKLGLPSLAIVDVDAPGFTRDGSCLRGPDKQWTLFFDDVELEEERLIGGEGGGLGPVFGGLNPERIMGAAIACGMGRRALDKAAAYANRRSVWNTDRHPPGHLPPAGRGQDRARARAPDDPEGGALYDAGAPGAGRSLQHGQVRRRRAASSAWTARSRPTEATASALEYGLSDMWWGARLTRTAPVSREMILNYVAEHSLGLPKSY